MVVGVLAQTDVLVSTDSQEEDAMQTTEQALASHESRMTCARANWKEWCALNNCVVPQWVKHGVIPVNTAPRTLTVKKATLRTSIVGSVLMLMSVKQSQACVKVANV
jgi:hypothetical protein